ncbi:hypothetical protein MMC21_006249 [Puttea exsequens]|nr:hypothetical protein [Puttea exsequens]
MPNLQLVRTWNDKALPYSMIAGSIQSEEEDYSKFRAGGIAQITKKPQTQETTTIEKGAMSDDPPRLAETVDLGTTQITGGRHELPKIHVEDSVQEGEDRVEAENPQGVESDRTESDGTNSLSYEGREDNEDAPITASTMISSGSSNMVANSITLQSETDLTSLNAEMMPVEDADDDVGDAVEVVEILPPLELPGMVFDDSAQRVLPPSIMQQACIIADQRPQADLEKKQRLRGFLQKTLMEQEEQVEFFLGCLADHGPWFGVEKRLSQENLRVQ